MKWHFILSLHLFIQFLSMTQLVFGLIFFNTFMYLKCLAQLTLHICLRLLIQLGSDVDSRDFDGWTPLHGAAHWGQEEACRLLSEALCDMEAVSKVVRGSALSSPTAFSSSAQPWLFLYTYAVCIQCVSGLDAPLAVYAMSSLVLLLCMLFPFTTYYCEPLLHYFSRLKSISKPSNKM